MAFASTEIIGLLDKIKYPYNVNSLTQQLVLEALNSVQLKDSWVQEIIKEREKLKDELEKLPIAEKVFPSDANFLLV
jgi:histidinol-phosphate aminotransferase